MPPAITTAVEQAADDAPLSVSPWAMRLIDVFLLLAMAAFHHGAAPVPRRPWLLPLPIGILLVPVPLFIIQETKPALRLLDWPGLYCTAVTAAMVVYLTARVSRRPSRTLPWSLALTLLAVTTIALRTVTLLDYSDQAQDTTLAAIASVQVAAVLAAGVPLAVLATRALRRLPPIPAAAPRRTTATE